MLGAITLDLFAVLFGGAIALLPLFAREILHTGPLGLGVLRSAPAVGALLAGVVMTRRPVGGRTGTTLLLVVGAFGARDDRLRALEVACRSPSSPSRSRGGVDMVSVNIRSTIAVVAAPNELRGRVTAVESVFISASNELGAFESGVAAALLGAVPAVVSAGRHHRRPRTSVWRWVFPDLATNRPDRRAPPGTCCVGLRTWRSSASPRSSAPRPAATARSMPTGATVREVLENLVATYPSLRERVFEGDDLPQFLNVFIDQDDIRLRDGLDTAVPDGATVILLPAVAGG